MTTRKKEHENYARIESHLHVDKGQARVKAYTSVNEPVKVDAAEYSRKIGGVTVRMLVDEDRNVKNDGSFYEKRVQTIQERDNDESSPQLTSEEKTKIKNYKDDAEEDDAPKGKMGRFETLKNFVDNVAADARQKFSDISKEQTAQWLALLIVAVLAAAALFLPAVG